MMVLCYPHWGTRVACAHVGRGRNMLKFQVTESVSGLATPSVLRQAPYIHSHRRPASPMDHDNYPDSYIRGILNTVKTIAMVGISPKDVRPSYLAFKNLLERGYRMIPVNPGQVGGDIRGQRV